MRSISKVVVILGMAVLLVVPAFATFPAWGYALAITAAVAPVSSEIKTMSYVCQGSVARRSSPPLALTIYFAAAFCRL
jgi:hypothetical protein